jgi:hypothetical protein
MRLTCIGLIQDEKRKGLTVMVNPFCCRTHGKVKFNQWPLVGTYRPVSEISDAPVAGQTRSASHLLRSEQEGTCATRSINLRTGFGPAVPPLSRQRRSFSWSSLRQMRALPPRDRGRNNSNGLHCGTLVCWVRLMPLSGSVNVAHTRGGRGPLKGWTACRERLLFGPRI